MVTVRAIAELAGVSVSTVSLVLNNKEGVSEATRRLVMDARDQLQARLGTGAAGSSSRSADHSPRSLRDSALSVVVLHPPILQSSFVFSEVLRGIQAGAEKHFLQLRLVANDPEPTPQHVAQIYFSDASLRPDGVIVFGARQHEPLVIEARQLGIPCVVLGRDISRYPVSGIGRDEESCAAEATQYLMTLGHRAIGFVGGNEGYDYVHNRIQGYRRALEAAQLESVPGWIQMGDGRSAMQHVLQQAPEVTAVLFVNDAHAADGLAVLQEAGVRIPDDLSVVSFDDTDIAREHDPPLTSLSYHRFEEGQWAVSLLMDHLRNPHIDTIRTIFRATLIVRDSCAPPRQKGI